MTLYLTKRAPLHTGNEFGPGKGGSGAVFQSGEQVGYRRETLHDESLVLMKPAQLRCSACR
jgi:hypothetical protein